jgi:hypothetical protein
MQLKVLVFVFNAKYSYYLIHAIVLCYKATLPW